MEAIDKLRELSKKLEDPYFAKEFEEDFEKILKERDMKIYHTRTLEDYDALMVELEEKGCKWFDGKKPTAVNLWSMWKGTTCLRVDNYVIFHGSLDYYREKYHNENIIEYKAKGVNKVEKKCEKCDAEYHDNAKYCSMCGKKLVEEAKFKVGDYVIEQNGNIISKIGEVLNGDFWGSYYKKINNYFGNLGGNILVKDIERLATPEEIKEYESALNFYKHGREPFEVKEGDLIKTSSGRNIIACYPENYSRVSFLKDGWEFLKTAEEVNEWIKGE